MVTSEMRKLDGLIVASTIGAMLAVAVPAEAATNKTIRTIFAYYSVCVAATYYERDAIGDARLRYAAAAAVDCKRYRSQLQKALEREYGKKQGRIVLIGLDRVIRARITGSRS